VTSCGGAKDFAVGGDGRWVAAASKSRVGKRRPYATEIAVAAVRLRAARLTVRAVVIARAIRISASVSAAVEIWLACIQVPRLGGEPVVRAVNEREARAGHRDPDGAAGSDFRLSGLPTTFIIDSGGRIADVLLGPQSESSLREALGSAG
jgi:hypothetical protein